MEPTELQEVTPHMLQHIENCLLHQALDFIESTNLKFFTKEMISEFMALKGAFLAQTGRYGYNVYSTCDCSVFVDLKKQIRISVQLYSFMMA